MRTLPVATALASLLALGCGPSALRLRAEENVQTTSTAVLEVRSSGGENAPGVGPALDETELWLRRAEHAIERWEGERSYAYETVAPCLARSLNDTREALTAAGLPIPESLDEAEAQAAGVVDATCPRPASAQRPTAPAATP